METKEVQTMLKETKDVGVETNRTPMGAVIIQKEKDKKKKSKMQKRQIKSIPNAVPSQEQQFRIFQGIDYPYMMRNVEIQNEEDKMVRALREVFGIKEKTPEMVADEALEKSVIKGRSYPIYTDEELTQQERRARAINRSESLRRIAGVSGLFDDEDRDISTLALDPTFVKKYTDYMSSLEDYKKENFPKASKEIKASNEPFDPFFEIKSKAGRPPDIVKKYEAGSKKERKVEKEREMQAQQFFESFRRREIEEGMGVAKSSMKISGEEIAELLGEPTSRKSRIFENAEEASIAIQSAIRNKRARERAINEKISKERQRQFQKELESYRKTRDLNTEEFRREIEQSFKKYDTEKLEMQLRQKVKKGDREPLL